MISKKNNEWVIQLSKNKKVILKPREIFLLKQLLIHEVMQSRSIHDFLIAVSHKPLTSNVLSNRIKRLVDTDILKVNKEELNEKWNTNTRYHYTLGKWGIKVLYFEKYLSREQAMKLLGEIEIRKVHKANKAMASILANEIVMKMYFDDGFETYNFSHQQAYSHPWIAQMSWLESEVKWPFSPEWIFETDTIIVCLITNTNISSFGQMDGIIHRYKKLAYLARDNDKDFALVFSLMDESVRIVPDEKVKNVNKKIGQLKRLVPSLHEWVDDMGIYILPAKRTGAIISGLTSLNINQSDEINSSMDFEFSQYFSNLDLHSFTFDVLPLLWLKEGVNKVNEVLKLYLKEDERYIVMIYGIEGSVMTFERVRAAIQRLTQFQNAKSNEKISIWIVYDKTENAIFDVIDLPSHYKIWLTDYQTWRSEINDKRLFPELLALGKYNRKSQQAYYESF